MPTRRTFLNTVGVMSSTLVIPEAFANMEKTVLN
jgi:hypothetical protein